MNKQTIAEKISSMLAQHIRPGDAVIAAVSGGPDSICLLLSLAAFAKTNPCTIVVAHVNHGIRGKAATRDEAFVKKIAAAHGLKCEVEHRKIKGSGVEEQGRNARRAFFEKLLRRYKAKWIVTAHTEDDQLETIVLNFVRGSGYGGLGGMRMRNNVYLKPLLGISKKEILAYLKQQKQSFCVDATNADTKLRRNFVRAKVIPLLEKLNPSLRLSVTRNAEIFRDIDDWLGKAASEFLASQKQALFRRSDFIRMPRSLQYVILERSFQMYAKTHYRMPLIKVSEILRMVDRNIGKKSIAVNKEVSFFLDKGVVTVGKPAKS